MTPVLIAVIAIVAVVLSVLIARRARAERNVVERQQQALDLLGRMADRAVSDRQVALPPRRYRPQHGRAPTAAERLRTASIIGAIAIGAVGLIVLVVVLGHHGGRSHQALPPPSTATTVARVTTTLAPTTTTTAPAPLALISDDASQASYRIQGSSVEVDAVSSAPCWVEVTGGGSGGAVTYAGVLRPGSVVTVAQGTANGASLLVADPALISLKVNGMTMALPQLSGGQPYTLHFEPGLA